MRLVRLVVFGLIFGVIGIAIFSWNSNKPTTVTNTIYKNDPQQQISRADDQTYAEEVSALTAKTEEKSKEIELLNQRINDLTNIVTSATQEAENKAKKEVQSLKDELIRTQEALESSISSMSEEAAKKFEELNKKSKEVVKTTEDNLQTIFNDKETQIDDESSADEEIAKLKKEKEEILSEFDLIKKEMSQSVVDRKTSDETEPKDPTPLFDFSITPNDKNQTSSFNFDFNKLMHGDGDNNLTPDGYLVIRPFDDPSNKKNGGIMGLLNTSNTTPTDNSWSLPRAERDPNSDNPFHINVNSGESQQAEPIPVYTIPTTATLVNNTTMSPLIGVVPDITNNVNDPFRFKIVTGSENLATNGMDIHGIDNIVWGGYVVGVRDQSCVRAYVDTVTYTFQDGTISTFEKGKSNVTSTESSQYSGMNALGYLTDEYGKPCIRGDYISNAHKYLADRSLAAFLGGIAQATSDSQMKYLENKDGDLSGFVTGDTGKYIAGAGIAGTANEIAKYVADRAAGAMDLIYVDSGINVQLFIETQIPIDYDPNARKLNYEYYEEF